MDTPPAPHATGQEALLPFDFAQRHGVVTAPPEAAEGAPPGLLPVLVRRDAQGWACREARRVLGAPLALISCDEDRFLGALEQVYGGEGADMAPGEDLRKLDLDIETPIGPAKVTDLLESSGDAPVIQLLNTLLRKAVRMGASDMHIEPVPAGMRVRLRLDGVLQNVYERDEVPVSMLISRLKVMAGLDIAETRVPQDGRIALRLGGRAIDVRLSTMPAKHAERVVMRILDKSVGLLSLDKLGLSETVAARLRRISASPNGLVLVTGPTGSGKTTTLYALLQSLNLVGRNIVTVEDPIEYELPGIGQTQVNSAIGMGFAPALRAILRQDPDIILVGEIRDGETAKVAIQAALTGHLVLSTLHTNTARAAATRLQDLGVEPFLVNSTLRGVIGQRLVRLLCRECAESDGAVDETVADTFRRAGLAVPDRVFRPKGCEACAQTGYRGRQALYEIIEATDEARGILDDDSRSSPAETLFADGLRCVAEGRTSLDEVYRVAAES